tara:strand:+ start:86 stop:520 length:435 start_codon:yes stop_codon:yes gene_type:complete
MNEWYIDYKYKLEYIFNEVEHFIQNHNIQLYIDRDQLFNDFFYIAYTSSNKPFTRYNYTSYNINKRYYNNEYDITIGSKFFDLLYDIKLELQEYDKNFLCRLHTHSLQNFFENNFHLGNICISKYIEYEQDNINEQQYSKHIDY